MCHCSQYKLSAHQVRLSEINTLNATTQQFITAKISGCTLKRGMKHTHHYVRAIYNCSSLRQSNFQLVKYEQLSIEGVPLDWLAHTLFARSNLAKLCKN